MRLRLERWLRSRRMMSKANMVEEAVFVIFDVGEGIVWMVSIVLACILSDRGFARIVGCLW